MCPVRSVTYVSESLTRTYRKSGDRKLAKSPTVGAEDAAQQQGYCIFLCSSDGIPREKKNCISSCCCPSGFDGTLLTKSPGELSARVRRMIADMKVPCLLMMRKYPILTEDAVITDDLTGSFDAVSHLARVRT
jgi:DNA-binding LacI/PurR family transcriptional regulator